MDSHSSQRTTSTPSYKTISQLNTFHVYENANPIEQPKLTKNILPEKKRTSLKLSRPLLPLPTDPPNATRDPAKGPPFINEL